MAIVNVKVIRDQPPVVIPSVQWGVVRRDKDQVWPPGKYAKGNWPNGITGVSRPTRNGAPADQLGLPATCRSENTETVDLDENLQRFMHQRSCERAGLDPKSQYAKDSFASFTRGNAYAFDFAGSKTNHDWINGKHEDAENIKNKPM